jgi:hypothetical protein
MTVLSVLDAAGRRRSPATMPGYHAGAHGATRASATARTRRSAARPSVRADWASPAPPLAGPEHLQPGALDSRLPAVVGRSMDPHSPAGLRHPISPASLTSCVERIRRPGDRESGGGHAGGHQQAPPAHQRSPAQAYAPPPVRDLAAAQHRPRMGVSPDAPHRRDRHAAQRHAAREAVQDHRSHPTRADRQYIKVLPDDVVKATANIQAGYDFAVARAA